MEIRYNYGEIENIGYENNQELKHEVTKYGMAPKESAADTRRYFLQTAFLQKAVEASKIKVSKKEAEKWAQKMMRAMDQQLANNGEDFKKYYEGTGTTEKELMDEFIKEAELIKKDIAISKGEEYIGTLIDASYN